MFYKPIKLLLRILQIRVFFSVSKLNIITDGNKNKYTMF